VLSTDALAIALGTDCGSTADRLGNGMFERRTEETGDGIVADEQDPIQEKVH
jgi:hypothetical protein